MREFKTNRSSNLLDFSSSAFKLCIVTIGLAEIYFLVVTRTYVPDEAWFLFEAYASAVRADTWGWSKELLMHRNSFGYGQLWWEVYALFAGAARSICADTNGFMAGVIKSEAWSRPELDVMKATVWSIEKAKLYDHTSTCFTLPLHAMRLVSFVPYVVLGALLLRNDNTSSLFSLTIFILSPVLLWSGKLAAPDLLVSGLFALAVYLTFFRFKFFLSILSIVVAISVKPTIVTISLTLIPFTLLYEYRRNNLQNMRFVIPVFLIIFLALNSYYIAEPWDALQTIKILAETIRAHPETQLQIATILFGNFSSWELTSYGSFFYFIGGPLVLIGMVAYAWKSYGSNPALKQYSSFLGAAFAIQFAANVFQVPHGWYWFPLISAIFLAPALVESSNLKPRIRRICFAIVLAPLATNAMAEARLRSSHEFELQNASDTYSCISHLASEKGINRIYDLAVIGREYQSANVDVVSYFESFSLLAKNEFNLQPGDAIVVGMRALESWPPTQNISQFFSNDSSFESVRCGTSNIIMNIAPAQEGEAQIQARLDDFSSEVSTESRNLAYTNSYMSYILLSQKSPSKGVYTSGFASIFPLIEIKTGTIDVKLENLSVEPWLPIPKFGLNSISLSYHILDKSTREVIYDGLRTPISRTLRPGDTMVQSMKFEIPPPGQYVLRVTVVQEGVAWFYNVGGGYFDVPLIVHPSL
ncbi:hypothetical protein ACSV5K_17845 [Agrobacterium pusense]|uniref:hypothetical protein n=1 Tax=Agrobacterium pusense TaxID=648995 RepID=UPI003FD231E4